MGNFNKDFSDIYANDEERDDAIEFFNNELERYKEKHGENMPHDERVEFRHQLVMDVNNSYRAVRLDYAS